MLSVLLLTALAADPAANPVVDPAAAQSPAKPPHIVLFLVDDFGRELLPPYGGQSYELPRLEALADESCVFETCYATPLCSPSRVELMTAMYSFRNYSEWGQAPTTPTWVTHLKEAGYRTVAAGKWHMGGWDQQPPGIARAGFESWCSYDYVAELAGSFDYAGNRFWGGPVNVDGEWERLDRYGPDVQTAFINDAIAATASDPRPLLAYFSLDLCHRPFHPTAEHPDAPQPGKAPPHDWLGPKGSDEHFPAMVRYVDVVVGRVLDAIEAAGISEQTIVVFTADNGTDNVHEAKPVRSQYLDRDVAGGKYFPTELGLNVPLMIRGPGVASPRRTEALTDFTDLGVTLLAAARAEPLPRTDGRDLRRVLAGKTETHKSLLWSWGNYEQSSRKYKSPADYPRRLFDVVRSPQHKWVSRGQLYDLDADWFEESPLRPADSRTPRLRLRDWNAELRQTAPKAW